jgi:hypothetical protein
VVGVGVAGTFFCFIVILSINRRRLEDFHNGAAAQVG